MLVLALVLAALLVLHGWTRGVAGLQMHDVLPAWAHPSTADQVAALLAIQLKSESPLLHERVPRTKLPAWQRSGVMVDGVEYPRNPLQQLEPLRWDTNLSLVSSARTGQLGNDWVLDFECKYPASEVAEHCPTGYVPSILTHPHLLMLPELCMLVSQISSLVGRTSCIFTALVVLVRGSAGNRRTIYTRNSQE